MEYFVKSFLDLENTQSLPVAYHTRPIMDAHNQDQQHKDFMSTFFPPAADPNHHRESAHQNQHQHQHQHLHQQQLQQAMFNTSAPAQPSMLAHSMHTSNGAPMDMDLIGSFMTMQGIESQSSNTQAAYNPQALLEQQFKLTQLQQLQQLQQQIFQQQVRCPLRSW